MKQLFIVVLMLFSVEIYANTSFKSFKKKKQQQTFGQGQILLHLGCGFVVPSSYGDTGYELFGTNELKKKFPINLMADYGVTEFLSAGLFIGFYGEELTITDNTNPTNIYGFKNKFKVFGLKTSYHQNIDIENIDPYVGLIIGYNACKAESFGEKNYLDTYKGGFAWSLYAGANYYFTDNIGAYLEAGYGKWIPAINLGITAKL